MGSLDFIFNYQYNEITTQEDCFMEKSVTQTKREYGSGGIYQINDNKWVARISLGKYPDGRRKVKALYGNSESEVKRKMKAYKNDAKSFTPAEVKKKSLEEFMRYWLEGTKKNTLKSSSYDRLENTCVHQIFPYLGWMPLTSITPDEIQMFINQRSNELSYSSVKKVYEALNAAFRLAVDRQYIPRTPMVGITLPKPDRNQSDIYFFQEEQIKKIKAEALSLYSTGKPRYRLGYAYILLLNTGMRIGEALALEWSDINFEKRTISITKTLTQVKSRDGSEGKNYISVIENTPKTKNSIRVISMNDNAYEALRKLQEINGKHKFVLANTSGGTTSHRTFDKPFRTIQKNCGISPQVGVHALRHTFASILFRNGVDVKTVSTLLGHSGTAITYNTYIHIINEQQAEALKIVDNI